MEKKETNKNFYEKFANSLKFTLLIDARITIYAHGVKKREKRGKTPTLSAPTQWNAENDLLYTINYMQQTKNVR